MGRRTNGLSDHRDVPLQSMKGDRSASFGTFDKALSDKFKRREQRTQSESDRRQRMLQDAAIPSVAIDSRDDSRTLE